MFYNSTTGANEQPAPSYKNSEQPTMTTTFLANEQ